MKTNFQKLYPLSYLFLLYTLTACNAEKSDWNKTNNEKIEYKVFETANSKNNSSKIEYGDDLLLHVKLTKEDGTVLVNSFDKKRPMKITLPTKMHRNQFEELLTFAKIGDSIIAKVKYVDAITELSAYGATFNNKHEKVILTYKILDVYGLKQKNEDKEVQYAFQNAFSSVDAFRKERDRVISEDSLYRTLLVDAVKKNKKGELKFDQSIKGIRYSFIEKGNGDVLKKGDKLYFYYMAALCKEETVFDDIFKGGSRMKIEIGKDEKVPKILSNSVGNLKMGSKAIIFVPASMAYGAKGSLPVVPPFADLMLYVEVVAVK
jgi:FKBP-type peptidyl-prolyl cis-trans isomerase